MTSHEQSADESDRSPSDRLVLVMKTPAGLQEFDLVVGKHMVGRASASQVFIDDASVSREHAEIVSSATGVVLHDLGSTNGTFVDGDRLDDATVKLRAGNELRFGNVVVQVLARQAGIVHKLLAERAFEERLVAETDRSLRYDRPLTVFAVETAQVVPGLEPMLAALLRSHDAALIRSPSRVDILAPECDRERAATIARRIVERLGEAGATARVGLAVFPVEVPSASSLCAAAEAALDGVTLGGFGMAKWGVRHRMIGTREIVLAEPSMVRLFGVIERLGKSDAPILVRGETGSGKEIMAEAIHALSARATKPLVRINCAAMPAALVESELFGHVRGAFSGAERDKVGLFEEADGGTLFLDEIGEFELSIQAKLLRVLEDRRIRRVGANTEIGVDVRIIAATHRNLVEEAAAGRFREDLYYRLSALVLEVPPLRERPREIAFLAERFVREVSAGLDRKAPRLTPAAISALRAYAWPGNVRELRNVIQRAVVACEGDELRPEHIGLDKRPSAPNVAAATTPPPPRVGAEFGPTDEDTKPIDLDQDLRDLERRRIIEALERTGGNRTHAAELLRMPRRTLVHKLRALKITRGRGKDDD